MVRVLSSNISERSLLKGFTGAVTDLAFAHLDSSLLGCVDEAGNLMVWQLTLTESKILYPEMRKGRTKIHSSDPLGHIKMCYYCTDFNLNPCLCHSKTDISMFSFLEFSLT